MIGDTPYFTLPFTPYLLVRTEHFEIFDNLVSLLISETRKGCVTHRASEVVINIRHSFKTKVCPQHTDLGHFARETAYIPHSEPVDGSTNSYTHIHI